MKISIYENLFYVFFFSTLSLSLCIECEFFFVAFMTWSEKERYLAVVFFYVLLEWHRFEFFMQIEGWWDKNKLYNCRWNRRASERMQKKKNRRKKKWIYFLYPMWLSECGWWITSQKFTFKRSEKNGLFQIAFCSVFEW